MNTRPILFSAPMVRAILAGTKTQTRRVVINYEVEPESIEPHEKMAHEWSPWKNGERYHTITCPYGVPGDTLWVRETWAHVGSLDPGYLVFRATYPNDLPKHVENVPPADDVTWKPSIHLRHGDARLFLRVTAVRCERLQEITDADAVAEGITPRTDSTLHADEPLEDQLPHLAFRNLWDSLNAKRAPWASNPWVWVVTFERIKS